MDQESSDPDLANFHLHLPLHVHYSVHTLEAIMQLLFLGTGAGDFQSLNDPTNDAPNITAARRAGGRNLRYASAALIGQIYLLTATTPPSYTTLVSKPLRFATYSLPMVIGIIFNRRRSLI